jgi:hypothetical protein
MAVPSFSATVADVEGKSRRLIGTPVTLSDWTGFDDGYFIEQGNTTDGRITAVTKGANSSLTSLDCATIFERLNTEQTCMPILLGDTYQPVLLEALDHWCLMAGVPKQKIEGNLQHYIGYYNRLGYMAYDISKWRYYGPPDSWTKYVPSNATYSRPLEVNPAQGIILGAMFTANTLAEVRLNSYDPKTQQDLVFTLRLDGNVYTVREKVGTSAEVVLLSKTFTHNSALGDQVYVQAKIAANGTSGVSVTLRCAQYDSAKFSTTYSDSTGTATPSTWRKRPAIKSVQLGYNPAAYTTQTTTPPAWFYIIEGSVLQENWPSDQVWINADSNVPGLTELNNQKWPSYVPGFTGNVWDALREFCAVYDLDVNYRNGVIRFENRANRRNAIYSGDFIAAPPIAKSGLSDKIEDREQARSVIVKYREREPDNDNNAVMFKADTVYSLEKGEYREEVVQTDNSFIFLSQPIPVSGVPVPYTWAYGSYVITGNDGYIVDPQWWTDNGGSVKVESTDKSGEIKIKLQAPMTDTTRAPYRISEGAADRPALYIMGYGLKLTKEKELTVYTGAPKAAQVSVDFQSRFTLHKLSAMNAGAKLAEVYGTANGTIDFMLPRDQYVVPDDSNAPTNPLNDSVFWDGSYFRIDNIGIGPRGISVSGAKDANTIAVVNGEFADGKTINDWNTLHDTKTIGDTNASPLPDYEG